MAIESAQPSLTQLVGGLKVVTLGSLKNTEDDWVSIQYCYHYHACHPKKWGMYLWFVLCHKRHIILTFIILDVPAMVGTDTFM